ncbi:MAG: hypothetical protein R2696_16870 [Microthrixaceae bacterium]
MSTAIASAVAAWLVMGLTIVSLTRHLPGWIGRPERRDVVKLVRDGRDVALMRPLGVVRRTMDRVIAGVVLGLPP